MPDDPNGFTAGSSMPAQQPTQSSDVGSDLEDSSVGGGGAGGNSGGGGSAPILNADPGAPSSLSSMSPTSSLGGPGGQPGAPPQKPSFFKGLITQLGLALAQGTKAGVEAPRSAQGPSIAASKAIAAPQEAEQAMTRRQMDQANIAMTQLKLQQMIMATHKMEQDQAEGVYDMGRDTWKELVEKKVATPLADGTLADVQKLAQQKQADYQANGGKGLLNLHWAPSVDGSMKDNKGTGKFSLYQIDNGTTDEATSVEIDYVNDFGFDPADLKAAGFPLKTTVPIPAGTRKTDVAAKSVGILHDSLMRVTNGMANFKKQQASLDSKESEGAANRQSKAEINKATLGNRLTIAELNNSTRRATAAMKGADDKTDKEIISASKGLVQANKALATAQGKFGNKAWNELSGGDAREITTLKRARDESQKVFDGLLAKKAGGATPTTKVPSGTKITVDIARQYLSKAGGDKAKAKQLAAGDGYSF